MRGERASAAAAALSLIDSRGLVDCRLAALLGEFLEAATVAERGATTSKTSLDANALTIEDTHSAFLAALFGLEYIGVVVGF